MSALGRRIGRLERRRPRPAVCPEHATTTQVPGDYRVSLVPFLPPDERAGLPEPEAVLACGRCGWRWEPAFDVVACEDRGSMRPTGACDRRAP